jgi:hypothetical protein
MAHDQPNPNGLSTGENSGAARGPQPTPRVPWHRPGVTIMDIKRTMLIVGSVIDGDSGSF